jgi:hypothetical protein
VVVTVKSPSAEPREAIMVNVEVAEPPIGTRTGLREYEQTAPGGQLEAVKYTRSEKSFIEVILIV